MMMYQPVLHSTLNVQLSSGDDNHHRHHRVCPNFNRSIYYHTHTHTHNTRTQQT